MNGAKYRLRIIAVAAMAAFFPSTAYAKAMDGALLESASTVSRGAWNFRSMLEYGSKAKPIVTNVSGTNQTLKVGYVLFPVEVRYGLTDNWELGGDFGFELNKGGVVITNAGSFLDGSGLRRIRMFGKWNFLQDMSAMADLAFAGDEVLYNSAGGFDFGLKFMYGPQIGGGELNWNLGFLFKGGDVMLGTTFAADFKPVINYGVGYVRPFSDRWTGLVELSGATSQYKGKTAIVSSAGRLDLFFGGRMAMSESMRLDGGLGFGFLKGSPIFLLRGGIDIAWGDVEDRVSSAPTGDKWTPTQSAPTQTQKPAPTPSPAAERKEAAKQPYYEPPARYETPKPAAPPAPSGPSVEEQLQQRIAEASTSFNDGDYVTAATQYEAAIKLKDNDPVLHYNLATSYFQQKKYAQAKTYFKNAILLNPSDVDSHLYLGYTHYYLQDQTAAVREWQKVIEIDPSNATARENLKSLGVE